jgi:hypothetical protein
VGVEPTGERIPADDVDRAHALGDPRQPFSPRLGSCLTMAMQHPSRIPHPETGPAQHPEWVWPVAARPGHLPSQVLSLRAAANRFAQDQDGIAVLNATRADRTPLTRIWTHEEDGTVSMTTITGGELVKSELTLTEFRNQLWSRVVGWTFRQHGRNGLGPERTVSNPRSVARVFADRAEEGESGILVGKNLRDAKPTTYYLTRIEGGVSMEHHDPDGTERTLDLTLEQFRNHNWVRTDRWSYQPPWRLDTNASTGR